MVNEAYYQELEDKFLVILLNCGNFLLKEDINEKFINREYGIAIQTLGHILITKKIKISKELMLLIDNVICMMGMKDEEDEDNWFWDEMEKYFSEYVEN
jgi:hypothetical protein